MYAWNLLQSGDAEQRDDRICCMLHERLHNKGECGESLTTIGQGSWFPVRYRRSSGQSDWHCRQYADSLRMSVYGMRCSEQETRCAGEQS